MLPVGWASSSIPSKVDLEPSSCAAWGFLEGSEEERPMQPIETFWEDILLILHRLSLRLSGSPMESLKLGKTLLPL
jgi:hypothetical protein